MYQEITEEELNRRLMVIDRELNFGIMKETKDLLNLVHTVFPLEYVMPDDFKGTHGITLKEDGKLQVSCWCNNKVYTVLED